MEEEDLISTTDRISELPDSIVHHILSLLKSPKELVRMSVLSKNWFALTASFPILDFDLSRFYDFVDLFRDEEVERFWKIYFKYVTYTTSRFCEQQNVSAHKLNLITLVKDCAAEDLINRCLGLILMKRVKVLVIDITWGADMQQSLPMYSVPDILLSASSLTSLTVSKCEMPSSLMVDVVKFKYLKMLELERVPLNEETIKRLTTSCPLLEELIVKYCHGFKTFSVYGLQNLQKVWTYFKDDVEKIYIDAPNLYYLDLVYFGGRGVPSMNLASCKKLTTFRYSGCPSLASNDLTNFLSNFPILVTLVLCLHGECNKVKLSNHSLKTFVLNSKCNLDEIDINTPNLLLFDYNGDSHNYGPLARNVSLSKARMECDPKVDVDAVWFKKLRRFLDKKIRFKELKLCISAFRVNYLIDDVEELKVIQSAPYKLEHIELEPCIMEEVPVYVAVLEAILWCCRPQSLILKSSFPSTNFEEWSHIVKFTYEKLLQQEDEGITNIQIVLSSSSKAKKCFSGLSSLLKASPSHRQGGTITFIKQKVVQEEAGWSNSQKVCDSGDFDALD